MKQMMHKNIEKYLEKLNKLIRILSNEKKEKEEKCLTERFNVKPENYKKIFNINNKRKGINVYDVQRKYSNSTNRINKTFNNLGVYEFNYKYKYLRKIFRLNKLIHEILLRKKIKSKHQIV